VVGNDAITIDPVGKTVTFPATWSGSGGGSVAADLAGAGVNPAVILDVLQLLADIKAKKGLAVIAADLMKVLTDLAPAEPAKKVGRAERAGLELVA
jgi:hypothetical protein